MARLAGVDSIAIGSTNIYNEVRHVLARNHRVGSIVLENNIIEERPMVVAAVSPRDSLLP
jgi:histone acetyltransferase (RNA polymerase elongator complex component)